MDDRFRTGALNAMKLIISIFTVGLMGSLSLQAFELTQLLFKGHEVSCELARQNREDPESLLTLPGKAIVLEVPKRDFPPFGSYQPSWRKRIVATVFWVGENATTRNPTHNRSSAWEPKWMEAYGGFDHPHQRDGYQPAAFYPETNPFYVALPYNDLTRDGAYRAEASTMIPWFSRSKNISKHGRAQSVCKDRWIAIHREGRVCFAQWKDVGPFYTDDWQYVFGGKRPQPNPNQNAGIDLSPAVRDFLRMKSGDHVDWKFVEAEEVLKGPWEEWMSSRDTLPVYSSR